MLDLTTSSKDLWFKLDAERGSLLNRFEECAKVTIPFLFPPASLSNNQMLDTPFQSLGARGVNTLASKLQLSLFPPNTPFFRYVIDEYTLKEIEAEKMKSNIEEALASLERTILDYIESSGDRVKHFEALRLLITTGNALIMFPFNDVNLPIKVFSLRNYVVKRDATGKPILIIVKETITHHSLPDTIKQYFTDKSDINLFTKVWLSDDDSKYHLIQEADEIVIPNSEVVFKDEDEIPLLPLRWVSLAGEDYGRGHIEQYLGDLLSYETLSKSVVQASAVASKILFLLSPNAILKVKDLVNSESGDIIIGNDNDVKILQTDKLNDLQITQSVLNEMQQRLSYAFLMNTAIQREAERVTASEIRYMAKELEDTLGGVYSILSQEYQAFYLRKKIKLLSKFKKIPKLPDNVKPKIITGIEALGRGQDLDKLTVFIQTVANLGQEAFSYLKMDNIVKRVGASVGIDMSDIVKTQEEIAQEQEALAQQQMMSQMLVRGTPEMMKQMQQASQQEQQNEV